MRSNIYPSKAVVACDLLPFPIARSLFRVHNWNAWGGRPAFRRGFFFPSLQAAGILGLLGIGACTKRGCEKFENDLGWDRYMEGIMAQTAVGLFEQSHDVDLVLNGLRAEGISSDAIRVLSKPSGMAVKGKLSTPTVDFCSALAKDLRSMGASEAECETYVDSVQNGDMLMFVTGTAYESDRAVSLMNTYGAVEIEEFAGAAPLLPTTRVGEVGANGISLKEDRTRAKSVGARVFTW